MERSLLVVSSGEKLTVGLSRKMSHIKSCKVRHDEGFLVR